MKIYVSNGNIKICNVRQKFKIIFLYVFQGLSSKGYHKIILQIGKTSFIPDCSLRYGFVNIEYFNASANILPYVQNADLIISHAGAGSILDGLECKKNLIVVANQSLMDNHQLELAEQLYKDKYLYYCTCETLLNIIQTMNFAKLKPFVNERSKRIAKCIDQIMGFSS